MIEPAAGAVICRHMAAQARRRIFKTKVLDLSAGDTEYFVFDPDFSAAIEAVSVAFQGNGADTGGTFDFGTVADTDAIVDAHAIANDVTIGTTEACALAATLNKTAGPATGSPVVPAGTVCVATVTAGANNTADPVATIIYSLVDPGQ